MTMSGVNPGADESLYDDWLRGCYCPPGGIGHSNGGGVGSRIGIDVAACARCRALPVAKIELEEERRRAGRTRGVEGHFAETSDRFLRSKTVDHNRQPSCSRCRRYGWWRRRGRARRLRRIGSATPHPRYDAEKKNRRSHRASSQQVRHLPSPLALDVQYESAQG